MKKYLIFFVCMLWQLGASAQFSGSGNGTAADPYRIYTDIHFAQMANFLNREDVVFELMKDIDLSSYIYENNPREGWTPIGVSSNPFKGTLKGNNHTVSGITINSSTLGTVGLFGHVAGATIQDINLGINNIIGTYYVGALCGSSDYSNFENVSVTVYGSVKGYDHVGGVVGSARGGSMSNVNFSAHSIEGDSYVGGLVGEASSTICGVVLSAQYVKGTSTYVGGVIGKVFGGSIVSCTATTAVHSSSSLVGGFAGYIEDCNISEVKTTGDVRGTSSVGGSFGKVEGTNTLRSITSIGNIEGAENVSGIAGELATSSIVTFNSCFSKGKITNTGDYTGGIVGKSNGLCINSMDDCSHFGDVKGKNYVGGLVGAVLKIDAAQPTLNSYEIRGGSSSSSTVYASFSDKIVTGSTASRNLNNCTAIGNIEGQDYVGGLVGESLYATAYTSATSTYTYTDRNNWSYLYLWKNGVYQSKKGCDRSSSSTYYYDFSYITYTKGISAVSLVNSYYSGNISAAKYVGGLIGHKVSGDIRNCYTYSTINGQQYVGGIAGQVEGYSSTQHATIKSTVANNASVTATTANVGRIYGARGNYVTIGSLASQEGNRALAQTSVMLCGVAQDVVDDIQNGTSVGPSMLRLKANYVSWGWDFDNNWNILETESYPYKKYQAAPPVIESKLESQAEEVSGYSINGGIVYMYYKDREAVSTTTNEHAWSFATEPLQSGAQVQLYTDVEDMTPSYFSLAIVKYPGDGTEEDPYRVYTAEDLQGANNSGYYKLMNDIDLTSWIAENSPEKGWSAIGRNSTVATYIDGDGHKVSGLWANTTDNYTGLFSNYSAGYIKNLTVEVAPGKKVKGGDYTGVLVGRMANGKIVNCTTKGEVEGLGHVGGIAGYVANSTINSNAFDGSIVLNGNDGYAGGLAGFTDNTVVTACNVSASITSEQSASCVAGLIGKAQGGSIEKSYTTNLSVTSDACYAGGLVGYSTSPITTSYSTGNVMTKDDQGYVGGLVGYTVKPVSNSYSTVDVTGTQYSGGLVAYTLSTIENCYAKGNVVGKVYGAGVVGELDGSSAAVSGSVAANTKLNLTAQSAWGCRVIGGFKNGCVEPTFGSNLALNTMQVSLNGVAQKKTDDNIEGVAKTADELMSSSTYIALGWDFEKTWAIDEGQMYPYLLWEVDINPVVEITFDKTTAVVAAGNTLTLTPNIQPLSATNKRLTWTTSKPSVATVEDGVVTAVSVGEATITATATDGSGVSAQCKVTVVANHDEAIAQLRDDVDAALALYNNSTEGDNIGEYVAGSRAALLKVINEVRAMISDTMDETAISDCSSKLAKAVADFKAQKVNAGEDTDITLLDNTIYIEPFEAAAGQTVKLSVKMKNNVEVKGFQFDLYLPEGVTVATDEDGFALADLSLARTTKNKTDYFGCEFQRDGAFRVLCGSTKGYAFNGTDGEVCTIELNIADDMEEGDFPIILKTVEMTDKSNSPYTTDYLKSTLTISSYTLGDVNNDGKVTITDFMCAADAILGNVPAVYVERAADFNTDGNVTVSDLMSLADYILSGGAPAKMPARVRMMAGEEQTENYIYLEPVTAARGGQQTLSVKMKNSESIKGYQVDIYLPEGMTFAQDEDDFYLAEMSTARTTTSKTDYFGCNIQSDGALRLLCGSTKGYTFSGNDGEVATVVVNVPEDMAVGDYSIILRNCELTNSTNTAFTNAYSESKVTVTDGEAEVFEEGYTLQIIPFAMDVDADFEASVMMDNVEAVKSIEFDLVLPEGLYLDGEDGEYFVDCGSRVTSSTVSGRFQSSVEENVDGSLHMLCNFSRTTASYVFTGNEGEALVLPLYADGLADGIYTLELKNIVLNGDLKVSPYKASVFVGTADAEGDIKLYGNYTEEAVDIVLDAFETNESITSVDMTEAYAVTEEATIETANPNALIYVAEGTSLSNTQNVVVGDECESLVLTDGYSFHAPVAFEAKNASYSRTVAQDGWYSLVLPFAAEVPGGVTVEKFQRLDEAASVANFAATATMEGDVPYIFEATAGAVAFEAQNVAVAATPATLTDGAFVGTYATTEAGSVTGDYALRADGTGFGVCDATAYVPAFRAWLQAAGGASNIRIAHDGVTAIQSVATDATADCYDLSGRRVSSRAKGVVINNNVKQIKK